jgi:hypothetical protein
MSVIRDTLRKLNKEIGNTPLLKRTNAEIDTKNDSATTRTLHVTLFILGNVFVIALFILIYFLFKS